MPVRYFPMKTPESGPPKCGITPYRSPTTGISKNVDPTMQTTPSTKDIIKYSTILLPDR